MICHLLLAATLLARSPETAMNINHIHWLGHASFRIEDGAAQIYVDPWKVPANAPKASVILITHGHFDHFSPEDIARIAQPSTVFVAPPDVAAKLAGRLVVEAKAGGSYTAGVLHVNAVPAYNVGKAFHAASSHWLGYVITLSSGQRIYHSGDTDAIPEMAGLKVDVAMMPCGGTYTMTAAEMAAAANGFKPGVLIPMHWGDVVGSKVDADAVAKAYSGKTVIRPLER
jgi:L-ascorbate metabolism protein UlaG (beta-lactamase superfamily)